MSKVVILGRGGAGKSALAVRLGAATRLPVVELDKHFWPADLTPISKGQWTAIQQRLTDAESWILDGDLGPYDVLDARLAAPPPTRSSSWTFRSGDAPGAPLAAPTKTSPSGAG